MHFWAWLNLTNTAKVSGWYRKAGFSISIYLICQKTGWHQKAKPVQGCFRRHKTQKYKIPKYQQYSYNYKKKLQLLNKLQLLKLTMTKQRIHSRTKFQRTEHQNRNWNSVPLEYCVHKKRVSERIYCRLWRNKTYGMSTSTGGVESTVVHKFQRTVSIMHDVMHIRCTQVVSM